ncbi:MAG: nucleoside triphosphate pyrophosphohydrolase [Desulfococcaceae bacterium]
MNHQNREFKNIDGLMRLIQTLRGEGGCPWDKKQTPETMALYLIEEVYELADAIESGDPEVIREELGDVLFQVLFIAHLFQEKSEFDIEDAAAASLEKMVRRHPHVFGDGHVDGAEDVRRQWHQIKREEKAEKGDRGNGSLLDSVPTGLPALMRAHRISERAARTGFDWKDLAGVMHQAELEWAELKEALGKNGGGDVDREAISLEFGDVLFTLVNVARFAKVHPEAALSGSTRKFEKRFKHMEAAAEKQGRTIEGAGREEMDRMWEDAKQAVDGADTDASRQGSKPNSSRRDDT